MNQFQPQTPVTKVSDVLLYAMALLESPNRWTKGCAARNAGSKTVQPSDETACKFCMLGAILSFAPLGNKLHNPANKAVQAVIYGETSFHTIPSMNDNGFIKHEEVLQVMTAAAFLALSEEDPQ